MIDFDQTIAEHNWNKSYTAATLPYPELFHKDAVSHWDRVAVSIFPQALVTFRPGIAAFFALLKKTDCEIYIVSRNHVQFLRPLVRYLRTFGIDIVDSICVAKDALKDFAVLFEMLCDPESIYIIDDDATAWANVPMPVLQVQAFHVGQSLGHPFDLISALVAESRRRRPHLPEVDTLINGMLGLQGTAVEELASTGFALAAVDLLTVWEIPEPVICWCPEEDLYTCEHKFATGCCGACLTPISRTERLASTSPSCSRPSSPKLSASKKA